MLRKCRDAIEKTLRKRGFTSPGSRRMVANQFLLVLAALAAGVLALPLTLWPISFALGTALACVNLWWMARSVHQSLERRFSMALALAYFGGFLFRFAGTGVVLYLLFARPLLPLPPFLAGLFSVVAWLMVTAFSRTAGNSCKET